MASPNNTYSLDELDDLEESAEAATSGNFLTAQDYVLSLLGRFNVRAALIGGYSLFLRGSPRRTYDIDVAVEATMRDVQNIIKNEQRLLRPAGPAADVLRIFVKTGPPHDHSSSNAQLVQVDLLIRAGGGGLGGSGASPPVVEVVTIGQRHVPMYDIPTMIRNKLKSFHDRQSENDMKDIRWLATNHATKFNAIRDQLDYGLREYFIGAFIDEFGEGEDADRMKQVLGVTWPPEE